MSKRRKHEHAAKATPVEEAFPNVAKWVNGYGWIEIGEQDSQGRVVRALDAGGMVFEKDGCRTLGESLAALDRGLAKWFEENG